MEGQVFVWRKGTLLQQGGVAKVRKVGKVAGLLLPCRLVATKGDESQVTYLYVVGLLMIIFDQYKSKRFHPEWQTKKKEKGRLMVLILSVPVYWYLHTWMVLADLPYLGNLRYVPTLGM